GRDGSQPAVRGWDPSRRLAQGRPVILVPGEKRRRIRSGTALRAFRDHGMEREHELERMAAGVPNCTGTAENGHAFALNSFYRTSPKRYSTGTEALAFHVNAMHIS